MRPALAFGALVVSLLLTGCGGSGGGGTGGGGGTATVSGRIVWIETGSGPVPSATVKIGSTTSRTDVLDGFFELTAPAGSTTATVTYVPSGGTSVVRTFNFAGVSGTVDLGDLYIGPQVVTLKGKVTDASTDAPVAGATVRIAGRSTVSDSQGQFSVANVAYSTANPAVCLGLEGSATAPNYFARQFSPTSLATGGVVQIDVVSLVPFGSGDPPPPPFDVRGTVSPGGDGATVTAEVGQSVLRRVTADSNGQFKLWLPKGTFTIRAKKGSQTGQTSVTVTSLTQIKVINVPF